MNKPKPKFRGPNLFFYTEQKREPFRSIGYSDSCKEFNEQVDNRQVRRHNAVRAIKAQRALESTTHHLLKRLAKRGFVPQPAKAD